MFLCVQGVPHYFKENAAQGNHKARTPPSPPAFSFQHLLAPFLR
jgi:hypothetical protein